MCQIIMVSFFIYNQNIKRIIHILLHLNSGQKQYEAAMIQYKNIDIKNSLEDMFGVAKIFYKLAKYQQCCKGLFLKLKHILCLFFI
jgi:hypothetical protein